MFPITWRMLILKRKTCQLFGMVVRAIIRRNVVRLAKGIGAAVIRPI